MASRKVDGANDDDEIYNVDTYSDSELGKAGLCYEHSPQNGEVFDKNYNVQNGGQNKETILLTVDCFKQFCFLAATPKAKEILQ